MNGAKVLVHSNLIMAMLLAYTLMLFSEAARNNYVSNIGIKRLPKQYRNFLQNFSHRILPIF